MSNLKNEEIVDLYNTLCKYRENFKPEIKIENNNTKNEELNESDINIKTIENFDIIGHSVNTVLISIISSNFL